ncbi:hypothetical protein Tamer19_75130 [Cupriavidus sp. TA19]|uniref:hypothetical protein n=1 Tax=unclassified Cupriavidus TaxID=2640874 RepID=UPI000E2F3E43|nr:MULTISPECIES: hypothetical protein [unclassified Cupriavidus]BDB29330.1 hypothetical protein CTP10_R67440 [Cupriavidus sp. P-10]GLC98104.1 hypothetical protein Tamer19_75130 [Cupriavidus sp. TA19]
MTGTVWSGATTQSGVRLNEQGEVRLGKLTTSFGLSLGITSVLSALLVILKETNEQTVLAWMKAATGHYWITHSLLDVLAFVILGLALLQRHPMAVAVIALGGVAFPGRC